MSILAGRVEPTVGSVRVGGAIADERDPAQRAQVAAMIGPPALYRDMTLTDHLTLMDATWGRDPATCESRVQKALHDFGLGRLASRFPHELSSGQSQLFRLSVTLFRPADLLILDEPEQRLDTAWRSHVGQVLVGRVARGTTVVMACHDQTLTALVADTVVDLPRAPA